ncbi:MAG: DHHA1 domain-containing protein [Candidatus Jorgensenbacteria bacterium]|nr:DHHA1 domain-containing protein [Candidatus Jorgensenbacteria bacterium]
MLYHANCPDGFGAAWSAWKRFGNKADYYPVSPNELPPVPLKKREIYLLDHCYLTPTLLKLRMMNEKVVAIDHHATNAPYVRHASEHVFDVKHSGAVLAWQYFHPKKKVPTFLKYVEDGDLWRFKLPQAKPLLSYLYSRPFDFKAWDVLARGMESARERKKYLMFGRVLADYDRMLVDKVAKRAELVQFGKYKVLAVNSSSGKHHSQVANVLRERHPPLSIVWRIERGMIHVSLRSDGTVDVGKLATQFPGGGGHPKAAGFTTPLSKGFPWRMLESK